MSLYYFIYFLVACGIPICFINEAPIRRTAQKLYFVFILLVLTAFAGARSPNVDRDFQSYAIWFNAVASGNEPWLGWIRDPIFALISYMVSRFGFAFSTIAFIYAFLGLAATVLFVVSASAQRWTTLFFYLFFCQYFIVADMTQIRAAVAIPLMASSLYFACDGRRLRAATIYMLALLFHFSVIVALPLLFLLLVRVKFRSRIWVVSFVALGIIASLEMSSLIDFLSHLYRISEFLNGGAEQNDLRVVSWYALAHLLPIAIGVLFLWNKLSLHQRLATLSSGLGLCLFVVFGANTGLATRFLYLFDLYWLLLFVVFLEKLKGNKRFLYVAFLIIFGLALYVKSLQYVEPYSTSVAFCYRPLCQTTTFI